MLSRFVGTIASFLHAEHKEIEVVGWLHLPSVPSLREDRKYYTPLNFLSILRLGIGRCSARCHRSYLPLVICFTISKRIMTQHDPFLEGTRF